MYGEYSREVSNQERVIVARVRYLDCVDSTETESKVRVRKMPIDVLAKPTLAEPAIYKCFGCKKILKTKELLDKHTHVHDRHIIHGLNVQFVMPCFLQWCFWINTSYLNTKKTWRLFKTSYKISISKLKIVSLAVEILFSKLSCLTIKFFQSSLIMRRAQNLKKCPFFILLSNV